ncbi:hypothetical protein EXIGLDRAFT_833540 [Exidia glandulosa HHB12029]|uniref:4Fe-4S ferredoxin-type domain-containing protein n=1 Tax=Exidia glandulosa HHB12029 TaxID=1314781 RepID=A0A165KMS0_EXIGL|nr:hypothetical protein EXIGLDRAFT_833540 [Exidia glandulosa HHB12029]
MARPSFVLLLALISCSVSRSHPPLLARNSSASRTASAIQARQLTRERLLNRAERTAMSNLFGREDCSIPQPSTLACTCGSEYELCGPSCRNTQTDEENCGTCDHICPGDAPGCCAGSCADFTSVVTCGSCTNECDVGREECCSGACANVQFNHDNCGSCGNPCDPGDTCCGGQCVNIDQDNAHCGQCFYTCDGVCRGGSCAG